MIVTEKNNWSCYGNAQCQCTWSRWVRSRGVKIKVVLVPKMSLSPPDPMSLPDGCCCYAILWNLLLGNFIWLTISSGSWGGSIRSSCESNDTNISHIRLQQRFWFIDAWFPLLMEGLLDMNVLLFFNSQTGTCSE